MSEEQKDTNGDTSKTEEMVSFDYRQIVWCGELLWYSIYHYMWPLSRKL